METADYGRNLQALGKVLSNGIGCESLTREVLLGFVSADRVAAELAVGHLSWAAMTTLIQRFSSRLEGDAQVAVLDWCKSSDTARSRRNLVIHSPWLIDEDDGAQSERIDARKRVVEPHTVEDVESIVGELGRLIEATAGLAEHLSDSQHWHGDPQLLRVISS